LFVALLMLGSVAHPAFAEENRPNVLLILADDLGFSDLGSYGGEIATPNLDRLANEGIRFTQFYNTARCWPTRASLMTGYFAQQVGRDALPGLKGGTGAQRPAWSRLLPEILREQGYRNYHSGKWHIDRKPTEQGFDHSYWVEDYDRNFSPRVHFLDDKPLPVVEESSGYYSSTAIADHAIDFLKEHHRDFPDKPFFHYVAFIVPHFPLHAPAADIAKYAGKYDGGWDEVRAARYERLKQAGIVTSPLAAREPDIGPPYRNPKDLEQLGDAEVSLTPAWSSLTPEQQAFQARKMSIHAAMVDRMDQEVGRILAQLKAMSADQNTLVIFLSDNGASAEIMIRGDGNDPKSEAGSSRSFLCLGPGWSSAANTPFRRHKTWVHEGGIATPCIMHWPQKLGVENAGKLRHAVAHVIDIPATILEVAGADLVKFNESAKTAGAATCYSESLLPAMETDQALKRDWIWWLHDGNRALRKGNWKIVANKDQAWELYDLSIDRCETENLADSHPKLLDEMKRQWQLITDNMIKERGNASETKQ
jgi:arylsulfatase A-like enzyme